MLGYLAAVGVLVLGIIGMVFAAGFANELGAAGSDIGGVSGSSSPATVETTDSASCPWGYYYHSSTQISLAQAVACALVAGFGASNGFAITIVAMAYQESHFCPGAIESGSGSCYQYSSGCGGQANAEGILQEGTSGQCPPSGGAFSVPGYSPSGCSSYGSHGWGGVYFNPECSFKWAHAYLKYYNSLAFWGSYNTGAYCDWAPNGFHGVGSVTCSGSNQNQAGLPWSSVCPGNKC